MHKQLAMPHSKRRASAFTIVELLVVIVVIGILAVLVVTGYSTMSQRAITSSLQSDLTQGKKQIENFFAVNGVYPTANNCTNTLASEICLKPSGSNIFTYSTSSFNGQTTYSLTATRGANSNTTTGGIVPSAVADGLIMNLDAGDTASYSGTGTTWTDLSGNGNNGTNSNSIYNSTFGGHFIFNDSSSVFTISNSSTLNPTEGLTIESWVNFNADSQDFIFEKGDVNTQYSLFSHGPDIVFRTYHSADTTYHTFSPSKNTAGIINGRWHHIVGSWDGSTKRIYVDGVLKSSVAKSGTLITRTTGAAVGRFGGTSAGYYFGGKISKVAVYNKGLSASEISQNFNAVRSRFGI